MKSITFNQLKQNKEWPNIDDYSYYLAEFAMTASADDTATGSGSFESKLPLLIAKWEKVMKRQASAAHHLCIMLAEFQRPGSNLLKYDLAALIQERMKEYRRLEAQLCAAFEDTCGTLR